MTGGMNSVPTISANATRLPRNSIRASAYAAGAAVASTRNVCANAEISELRNQRKTGNCAPAAKMPSYACDDGFLRIVGGVSVASGSVLKDVSTIHTTGTTNSAA